MNKTEAELADMYNETRDVVGFVDSPEPVEVRRGVTISVRFSDDEMQALRARATEAGVKVTAFIRSAALELLTRSTARRWLNSPLSWSSRHTNCGPPSAEQREASRAGPAPACQSVATSARTPAANCATLASQPSSSGPFMPVT